MTEWLKRWFGRAQATPLAGWLLAAVVVVLAAISCTPAAEALFSPLDRLYWHLVATHVDRGEHRQVAVIAIDRKTVSELGAGTSYARTSHAQVLNRLGDASSVVLDLTMMSPGTGDAALAEAMARQGRVVIPAQFTAGAGHAGTVLPTPLLAHAAAAVGQRSVVVGSDHLVQGIVPYVRCCGDGAELPHVALQAIRLAGVPLPLGDVRRFVQDHVTSMGHVEPGTLALFLPTHFDLDRYSYVDVLKGRIPASTWRGRLVFVGDAMSDLSGTFNLSSSRADQLNRVEVEAMMTEALLGGHVLLREPVVVQWVSSAILALGMLLICVLVRGWLMYACSFAWLAAFIAVESLLLLRWAYWLPLGPPLAVCGVIFAVCGWRRAGSLRDFLLKEYGVLRSLVSERLIGALSTAKPSGAADIAPAADEVAQAMQQIREWQTAYVGMIETLPYPIFVEQQGKLLLCNESGRAMLDAIDGAGDAPAGVEQVLEMARSEILGAKASGQIHSVELTWNARAHLMMVTPIGDGDKPGASASMICLVDIHNIKAAVESDRLTLRHMAHDLRNPLSTVLSLLNERSHADAGADTEFLSNLHKLVDYSLRIAQNFTQLSRAEHLDPSTYVPVALNDLATEAVDQVWHSSGEKRILVEGPHYAGDDVFVLANRDMLLRALVNLLDNAIKYSDEGRRIDVWIEADAQWVTVSVKDQGIGIPEDALAHLFEPFFQVDGSCHDASRGVGLGLPFVKAVVGRHGGAVAVSSVLGQGSSFTIRMPRTTPVMLEDE
ncbi:MULTISPECIES: ATP-binding protein [Cupriavidus]|uniref:ATP-binding protein n=1 Tax=Cupriavidus TaxID=106589 RepID=UPI0016045B2E|nr:MULTISPECIES: ATP-binding protein [Cupriavidus]MBB1634727.1 histidine kinase [Cupriavidus sp. UME77]MDR3382924.1 CHASE2 and HATPase_c domain-containing protein [Cupriavidus basilensis]MDR3386751.1 CHASE2 and HATPase_c domain-containing protein [Rudaea sp.]